MGCVKNGPDFSSPTVKQTVLFPHTSHQVMRRFYFPAPFSYRSFPSVRHYTRMASHPRLGPFLCCGLCQVLALELCIAQIRIMNFLAGPTQRSSTAERRSRCPRVFWPGGAAADKGKLFWVRVTEADDKYRKVRPVAHFHSTTHFRPPGSFLIKGLRQILCFTRRVISY